MCQYGHHQTVILWMVNVSYILSEEGQCTRFNSGPQINSKMKGEIFLLLKVEAEEWNWDFEAICSLGLSYYTYTQKDEPPHLQSPVHLCTCEIIIAIGVEPKVQKQLHKWVCIMVGTNMVFHITSEVLVVDYKTYWRWKCTRRALYTLLFCGRNKFTASHLLFSTSICIVHTTQVSSNMHCTDLI